jgi:hypothetical protein
MFVWGAERVGIVRDLPNKEWTCSNGILLAHEGMFIPWLENPVDSTTWSAASGVSLPSKKMLNRVLPSDKKGSILFTLRF